MVCKLIKRFQHTHNSNQEAQLSTKKLLPNKANKQAKIKVILVYRSKSRIQYLEVKEHRLYVPISKTLTMGILQIPASIKPWD